MQMREIFPILMASGFGLFAAANLSASPAKESATMHAHGEFEVKITPQKADNPDAVAAGFSRIALDKRYHGSIEGVGKGEMLAAGDGSRSGAYVALEMVSGSLDGHDGSFALLHSAMLVDGAPRDWKVSVVPDSGTGQLRGLEGELRISMADGKHSYDLAYTLPAD